VTTGTMKEGEYWYGEIWKSDHNSTW
jgi:hypothetical protein